MKAFQFSKPKNPGFGISKDFYLSVLSSKSVLPTMLELINPSGVDRAIEGYGAPLMPGADKAALSMPLQRGSYVLASKDRKTVLRMRVLSKEEAGFDPAVYVRSSLAVGSPPELGARMLATWQLLQLTFESHHAMVYPACDFLLDIAQRLAQLCEGVIADPMSGRYLLPEQLRHIPSTDQRIDARNFVAIQTRELPNGLHVFTAGMRKFALEEYEVEGIEESLLGTMTTLIYSMCQARLLGAPMPSGSRVGAKKAPFELREGGLLKAIWEGIPVFELLPPTGLTASQALREWSRERDEV